MFKTTIIFYSQLSYIIILCRVCTVYIEHLHRSYVVYDFYVSIYKKMHFKMFNIEYSFRMPVNLLSWCMGEINMIYIIYFLISIVEILLYDK